MPSAPVRRPAARRAAATLALVAGAGLVVGGCGDHGNSGARERREIRRAAAQAARLATAGDTSRRAKHDTGLHFALSDDQVGSITRAADPPLGPGDVRVASTDGAVVLALIGDTVRMRLGDSLAAKVRREAGGGDTSASGFGGFVSSAVRAAVGGAVGEMTRFAVRVPVAEVRDLRYEDGRLHFNTRQGRRSRGDHGTGSAARFAPEDAERFIAAVRARQQARGAGR